MALKIWSEPVETDTYLRLIKTDKILLQVVDSNGDPVVGGLTLSIDEKEGLTLHTSMSRNIGLPLDTDGRIKIKKLE